MTATIEGLLASMSQMADSPLLFLGAGLLVGLYHALEPDHVAAMLALTGRRKDAQSLTLQRSWRVAASGMRGALNGLLWGFGHTSAILLTAIIVFAFSFSLPPEFFVAFEALVGVMLLALGLSAASGNRLPVLSRLRLHSHPHKHENGTVHSHMHSHRDDHDHEQDHKQSDGGGGGADGRHRAGACTDGKHPKSHSHRSYLVGCIHGLAGSGGLVVLLATPEFYGSATPLVFASVFGAGSVLGMTVMAGVLSLMFVICGITDTAKKALRYGSGAVAIAFGVYILGNIAGLWM